MLISTDGLTTTDGVSMTLRDFVWAGDVVPRSEYDGVNELLIRDGDTLCESETAGVSVTC